ncbi:MAG TPA: DUF4920 domain-containing protein [Flavobacteriaceae bacterium]
MNKFLSLALLLMLLVSCKEQTKTNTTEVEDTAAIAYTAVGLQINDADALSSEQMSDNFEGLKVWDTLNTKMVAKVDAVCQAKGCWMTLNLEDGNQVMVKFKDYGFFVPKDIAGKEVIVNGLAFVEEVSVDEQRHYAEDAGKSAEEIAAITTPKKTFSFEADGVLIKN